MVSSRRLEVDGKEIFVFDDFLTGRVLEHFTREFETLPFHRLEADRSDRADFLQWVVNLDVEEVVRQPYFHSIARRMAESFPGEDFELARAYANSISFGDMSFPHRDSKPGTSNCTALLYLTAGWDREWGGETIFFGDDGEARIAVTPKPGRLVVFRGAIEHRGEPPLRTCQRPRLCLVLKFRPTGSDQTAG